MTSPFFPAGIVLANLLSVLLLAFSLLFLSEVYWGNDERLIEIYLPPQNFGPGCGWIQPIGYGEIAIIADGNSSFYLHLRGNYLEGEVDEALQELELKTGLSADDIIAVNKEKLAEIIFYHMELDDLVITFSFTDQAKFMDIISLFDLMNRLKVKKYAWVNMQAEEIEALRKYKAGKTEVSPAW